jgi:hypothetical protein
MSKHSAVSIQPNQFFSFKSKQMLFIVGKQLIYDSQQL